MEKLSILKVEKLLTLRIIILFQAQLPPQELPLCQCLTTTPVLVLVFSRTCWRPKPWDQRRLVDQLWSMVIQSRASVSWVLASQFWTEAI